MNKLPKTMYGIVLTGHGDFDRLQIRDDLAVPKPGPYQVVICVGAAAVNNTDINTRTAWYSKAQWASEDAAWAGDALHFPRIQGADVCGHIVAIGDHVSQQRLNQRVLIEPCLRQMQGQVLAQPWYLGSECDGCFAEYVAIDSIYAHQIDSPLSDIELASFPCSYSTAENLLSRAKVTAADRVLVTGASGGVGSAVVQLSKARGAEVIGITSPSKADEVSALGADNLIFRDDNLIQKLGRNSVDAVIDIVAGAKWPELLDVLKPKGRYAVAGAIAGPIVELDVRTLYLKDLSLFGCTVLDDGIFANLVKRIEQNDIAPLVAKTFPLSKIVEAQKYFLSKQHTGKIVLTLEEVF